MSNKGNVKHINGFFEKFKSSSLPRFLITGGCSTAIDFMVYLLLSRNLPTAVSKGISMLTSSVFSYFVNKRFTFRNQEKTNLGYLLRFYAVFALNLGANIGMNELVFRVSGHKIFAFLCATAAGMTVNYLGQKRFVFRKENHDNTHS